MDQHLHQQTRSNRHLTASGSERKPYFGANWSQVTRNAGQESGSTWVARRARIELAASPAAASRAPTAVNVHGSDAETPHNSLAISRVRAGPASTPRPIPAAISSRPLRRTTPRIWPAESQGQGGKYRDEEHVHAPRGDPAGAELIEGGDAVPQP